MTQMMIERQYRVAHCFASLKRSVQWRIQKILVEGDDKNFKHKTTKIRMCCNQARSQKFAMERLL